MNKFVTLRSFDLPTDLAIVRLKVEEAGIEYHVADELTVQTYNFLSNAVGGVKLQVRPEDYERANELLESLGYPEGKVKPSLLEKRLSNPQTQHRLRFVLIGFIILVVVITVLTLVK